MFGHSPLKPIEAHMRTVNECAQALLPFFKAVLAKDGQRMHEARDHIAAIEEKADALKKDIRLHLPKGLFLPVARSDLLAILAAQDSIANKSKDIAGIILGRQMTIPDSIADIYMQMLKRAIDSIAQANQAINELDQLLETGFRGNEVTLVENMIIQLDKLEQDTDALEILVRGQLFAIESTLPPITAIFLYKIIDWTGDLADGAQKVGGLLQLLLAR
jgi:predicted phosphate transport protein (TIGR00153 family)